jgi:hypothetical protein
MLVAVRMDGNDSQIHDFLVAPRCAAEQLPRLIKDADRPLVEAYLREGLQAVAETIIATARNTPATAERLTSPA